MTNTIEKNADAARIVSDYFAAINAMDAERWLTVLDANIISDDPPGMMAGHESHKQFFLGVTSLFSKIHFAAGKLHETGNKIAFNWSATGTGKNGHTVEFDGI